MRPNFLLRLFAVTASIGTAQAYARNFVSVADIAENANAGVVNIRTTQYVPNKDPALDLYQFFLNEKYFLHSHSRI